MIEFVVRSLKSWFQVFSFTMDNEIRIDDLCLDVSKSQGPVTMVKCHHLKGNQFWEYNQKVKIKALIQFFDWPFCFRLDSLFTQIQNSALKNHSHLAKMKYVIFTFFIPCLFSLGQKVWIKYHFSLEWPLVMEQGSPKGGLSTTLRFLDIPTEATKWSKFDFKSCSNQLSDSLLSSVSSVTLFLSKSFFFTKGHSF